MNPIKNKDDYITWKGRRGGLLVFGIGLVGRHLKKKVWYICKVFV